MHETPMIPTELYTACCEERTRLAAKLLETAFERDERMNRAEHDRQMSLKDAEIQTARQQGWTDALARVKAALEAVPVCRVPRADVLELLELLKLLNRVQQAQP